MKNNLSSLAKTEIQKKLQATKCCSLAFLSAIIHTAGSLLIDSQKRLSVIISCSTPSLKKSLDGILGSLYGITTIINKREILLASENVINILCDCGILRAGQSTKIVAGIDNYLISSDCCKASYCGGVLIGAGSLSATKSGYHLEFSLSSKVMAQDLIALLQSYGINAKYLERKDKHIVYVKGSEAVADCLTLAGAQNTALQINGISVDRQVRQQSNRRFNCDMANLDRAISTGIRQAELFSKIVDKLTDNRLIETAKARIANTEASYDELAKILNISKSGVKHRLKKLEQLCSESEGF